MAKPPPEPPDWLGPDDHVVLDDVRKSFGPVKVLRGIDISFKRHETAVIIGGSGNNWGAILGGFVVWFFWIEAEPIGLWFMDLITSGMAEDSELRIHLLKSAAHIRLMAMGVIMALVLRFAPRGLIPEKKR